MTVFQGLYLNKPVRISNSQKSSESVHVKEGGPFYMSSCAEKKKIKV